MTQERFSEYATNEEAVWNRFLDTYEHLPTFKGIKQAFRVYEMHPDGTEEYDIRVNNARIIS